MVVLHPPIRVSVSHLCQYLQPIMVMGRLPDLHWILDWIFFCCSLVQVIPLQIHWFLPPPKKTAGDRHVPTAVWKILLTLQLLQFSFNLTIADAVYGKEQFSFFASRLLEESYWVDYFWLPFYSEWTNRICVPHENFKATFPVFKQMAQDWLRQHLTVV